jgi:replicative DNA helicase
VHVSSARGELVVVEAADRQRFCKEIAQAVPSAPAAPSERLVTRAPAPVSTVPEHVWQRVRTALVARQPVAAGSALTDVVGALGTADLELAATNDVLWDEVVEIAPLGQEEVYDATVLGTHNFVADGIAVHNSIEQDADMVILLHREDAYEKESPRAGEADFIVAKHRNGPTATITVAFQGHYSRFVDMNPG